MKIQKLNDTRFNGMKTFFQRHEFSNHYFLYGKIKWLLLCFYQCHKNPTREGFDEDDENTIIAIWLLNKLLNAFSNDKSSQWVENVPTIHLNIYIKIFPERTFLWKKQILVQAESNGDDARNTSFDFGPRNICYFHRKVLSG